MLKQGVLSLVGMSLLVFSSLTRAVEYEANFLDVINFPTHVATMLEDGKVFWYDDDNRETKMYEDGVTQTVLNQKTDFDNFQINNKGMYTYEIADNSGTIVRKALYFNDGESTQLLDSVEYERGLEQSKFIFSHNVSPDGKVLWSTSQGTAVPSCHLKTYYKGDIQTIREGIYCPRPDGGFLYHPPPFNQRGQVTWYKPHGSIGRDIYLYDGNDVQQITNTDDYEETPTINESGDLAWRFLDTEGFRGIAAYIDGAVIELVRSAKSVDYAINNGGQIAWVVDSTELFLYEAGKVIQYSEQSGIRSIKLDDSGWLSWLTGDNRLFIYREGEYKSFNSDRNFEFRSYHLPNFINDRNFFVEVTSVASVTAGRILYYDGHDLRDLSGVEGDQYISQFRYTKSGHASWVVNKPGDEPNTNTDDRPIKINIFDGNTVYEHRSSEGVEWDSVSLQGMSEKGDVLYTWHDPSYDYHLIVLSPVSPLPQH